MTKLAPKMNNGYDSKWHRDQSVTHWDVSQQRWVRIYNAANLTAQDWESADERTRQYFKRLPRD